MAIECWVCERQIASLEKGHLIDRCIGGNNDAQNIRLMCYECNRVKPIHNSLWEVAAWKVKRHHEILFGLSKPLGAVECISQMQTILVKDFKFPDVITAWRDLELKQEQEARTQNKEQSQRDENERQMAKRNRAEIEADRLWRAWCEFNYPPTITKENGIDIRVSIIPQRPGKQIPNSVNQSWQKLWQRLLGTT